MYRDMTDKPRYYVAAAIQIAVRDEMLRVYGTVPQLCVGHDAWADRLSCDVVREALDGRGAVS